MNGSLELNLEATGQNPLYIWRGPWALLLDGARGELALVPALHLPSIHSQAALPRGLDMPPCWLWKKYPTQRRQDSCHLWGEVQDD